MSAIKSRSDPYATIAMVSILDWQHPNAQKHKSFFFPGIWSITYTQRIELRKSWRDYPKVPTGERMLFDFDSTIDRRKF